MRLVPDYEDADDLLNELMSVVEQAIIRRPNGSNDLMRTKADLLAKTYDSCKKRREFIGKLNKHD